MNVGRRGSKVKNNAFFENVYRENLSTIERLVGHKNVTYLDELLYWGKILFNTERSRPFKGVFAKDQKWYSPSEDEGKWYAIVNLDSSGQGGSHWIGIAYEKHTGLMFYDSFGRNSRRIFPSQYQFLNTDPDAEQHMKEENCGQRCLAWLKLYHDYGPEAALGI